MSISRPHYAGCVWVVLAALLSTPSLLRAQSGNESTGHSFAGAIQSRRPHPLTSRVPEVAPIKTSADYCARFKDGDETVLMLRGNCQIEHRGKVWHAPLMVLWEISPPDSEVKQVIAYLETSSEFAATAHSADHREQRPFHLVDLETDSLIEFTGRKPEDLPGTLQDPAYIRARKKRSDSRSNLQLTQYTLEAPSQSMSFLPAPTDRIRQRVTIAPKFLGGKIEAKGEISEGSIPAEYVITITGGVNIVVDNVPLQVASGQTVLSRIDLTADRAVIWTDANHIGELGGFEIDANTPFQVYLEGSIVVRQGSNDIRATHAYYDINQHRGLTMNTEIRSLLPDLQGSLRLRAAEVRQNSDTSFHAKDAYFTTSEFGSPKYRVQASDIFLEQRPSGNPADINPVTGEPEGGTFFATSLNNVVFVGDYPIFAAPYLSGVAEDPHIPLRRLNAGWSGMFGATIETAWDMQSLLGLNLPSTVDWQLQADYLSERGPAIGTRGLFELDTDLFGMPVHKEGWGQIYYINDHGLDNLGLGRRDLAFPNDNRGRAVFRDRTYFGENTWLQAEIGTVFNDDRNFMEQYFEHEWDTQKDLENALFLNHQVDNFTASLLGTATTNEFNDETSWLPKSDLTLLGQPLFGSPVIWSQHSSVGYGILNRAQTPPDANDPFTPLPYFADVEGTVAMTRHQLNLPFDVGPVHVNPYALGELAYWEQNLNAESQGRAYGKVGFNASIEFAKYMPQVRNSILGLNGLAHKVVYDFEYFYAQSSADLNDIAQYNAFDENAQERFRERLLPVEFGLPTLPAQFDPRFYAVRSGAGSSVTAPYHELVDDMQVMSVNMRHRWQTKVGPPDVQRIVDWMELDLGTSIFPNGNEDNFGETFGLVNGRYAWHVSPRTSFLANAVTDFFSGGQKVWNVGVLHQRGGRGSAYLGYRNVEVGPIDSKLITGSFSYVMSPNLYVMTAAAQYDVAEGLGRGESLTITRIGEFFLLHMGVGYDRSRNVMGAALSVEPKFGSYGSSSVQLNSLLGIR
ncbi:hypothetical protein SH661x_000898 [Planctomicrobium sp. SH661]|uniref:hypothetical protein n=1 Tax=Planctomicrobium sp. SH661 TaxID=3448124 RepID=UPI003F5BEA27